MSDKPERQLSPSDGNICELILTSKHLPDSEKTRKRITEETLDLLSAGGETTARTLTTAMYHILANREKILPRLKAELSGILVNREAIPDVKDLERLSWLVSGYIR